jgi:TP901 family phage tail tape measure protein
MMGNYERTMELVTAANNSAGASQKQFDKTLESLDAKLQRLKNAWAEFTMGLANNELIKFGVDLLTSFVTVINKITEALPGATGNMAKLLLTIGGLKAGGAIFDSFF